MREFKEEGPACKCCAPKPEGEKITKAYARGVSDERERTLAWLKFQTLHTQYEGLDWIDACVLLQENFQQQTKGENE